MYGEAGYGDGGFGMESTTSPGDISPQPVETAMSDTVVSDAVAFPQDEGLPNIADDNESWSSAGLLAALAEYEGDSYIRAFEHGSLAFSGHDGTNDTVDIGAGSAFLELTGETVNVQSTMGGSSTPAYDAALPNSPPVLAILPSGEPGIPLQDATASDIWLAYATDGTVSGVSAGDIYVRSDDTGSVTAPPHPNIRLGSVNPDDDTSDVLDSFSPPGVWVEDPNSPWSETGVTAKQTFELGVGEAEQVRIRLDYIAPTGGSGRLVNMTVNGETGSVYSYGEGNRDEAFWPIWPSGNNNNDQKLSLHLNAFEDRLINGHGLGAPMQGARFLGTGIQGVAVDMGGPQGPLTQFGLVEEADNEVDYVEVVAEVMVPR